MSISVKLQKAVYTAVAAAMILGAMFAYSIPKTLAAPAYDYELITQSAYPSTLAPGETTNVWIEVKNTGTASWYNDVAPTIRLGSGSAYGNANQQRDYASEFANSDWLSTNRPVAMLHPEIRPGWHTRFQFNIKAPSTAGTYKAYFTPVADGLTWMKDIGIYWQLTVSGEPVEPEEPGEEGTAGGTTVSLSSSTPSASTVLIGATGVPYLKFNIESDGAINEIVVKRTGVGASSDFENVYLYDGNTRLTSGRSVASDTHMATFINLGLTGASKTLTLKADISTAAGALNQSAFEVYSVNGNVLSSAVKGNTMTIGSQTIDTVILDNVSAGWSVTLGESQAEVAKLSINASGATNDVILGAITLRQSGSLSNANIENLVLKEGSNEIASVASMDGEKAVFVLSSPYTITKGQTKNFTVLADIAGGRTTDNIKFYIDEKTDVDLKDSVYNLGMQLTNSFAFGDQTITIEGGTITLVDNGPVVSTYAVNSTQNAFLNFAVTADRNATVKKAKVNMKIYSTGVEELYGAANFGYLKNIRIVDTDTGSTIAGPLAAASSGTCVEVTDNGGNAGVCEATDTIYYTKEFTDQFDLVAGTTRNLALKADIDTSFVTTGRTIVLGLDLSGANYVYDTDASEYVANTDIVPNTLTGNSMSVGSDSLTVSLASTPVTSTSIKRATDVLAVGHLFKSGDTNSSKVTKLVYTGYGDLGAGVVLGQLDDLVAAANLYVDGSKVAGPVSVNTSDVITFNNLAIDITAGQTKKVELALDITSTAGAGDDDALYIGIANDTDITVENGDGNTFTAVDADGSAPWDGNDEANDDPTVTINIVSAGSITSALDADAPSSAVAVAGKTSVDTLKIKYTTQYEDFTINKMRLYIDVDDDSAAGAINAESTSDNNIASVVLSYNGTSATGYLSGGMVSFTNLGINIPKDDSVVVTAKINYNTTSAGATSGAQVELVYDASVGFEAVGGDSGSTVTDSTTDVVGGGIFTVRKTVPTISLNSASPSGTLLPGVTEIIRINITADAGGDVIFDGTDTIDFDIASNLTPGVARNFDLYDAATNNTVATQVAANADNAGTIAFTDVNLTVAKGTTKTLYVKGDLIDYSAQGDTFRLDINATSGLTWGDGVVANIATDTALIDNIPLTGNTLVKP